MDQYKYRTNPNKAGTCTIFKTSKGKHLHDTLPYLKNMVKYIKGSLGCSLRMLVCDFVKDESGIWWLINIKRIITDEKIPKIKFMKIIKGSDFIGDREDYEELKKKKNKVARKRFHQYQNLKTCRYCEQLFPNTELTKKMTLKMIVQMDKHLKHRGYRYEWLDRSLYQFLDT